MKFDHYFSITSKVVIVLLLALTFNSCQDDITSDSKGSVPPLSGTKWQSGYVYGTPTIDPDWIDINKSMTTLYFLDDHRYIAKIKAKDFDSNLGTSNTEGIDGGTYTISGTKITTKASTPYSANYVYKNGHLVVDGWDEYVLEKQGNMTASEKEWAETEFYGCLPDAERLNFKSAYGAKGKTPKYISTDHCYYTTIICGLTIEADQKIYEKKISSVRGTLSLQNGKFSENKSSTLKKEVLTAPGERIQLSFSNIFTYSSNASIKVKYDFYDSKTKKYITLVEETYPVNSSGIVINGL